MAAVLNNPQITCYFHNLKTISLAAIGWMGKHKVEVIGAILTTAIIAAVIATSIATFGTTAIVCGAALGSAALLTGAGTAVLGAKHHIAEKKEAEEHEAARRKSLERSSKLFRSIQYITLGIGLVGLVVSIRPFIRTYPRISLGVLIASFLVSAFAVKTDLSRN